VITLLTPNKHDSPLRQELRWLLDASRAPRIRTLRQFATDEIVIPDGPAEGRRFRLDRQPYAGLVFDALQLLFDGHYSRGNFLGPTQSGKTLTAFGIPSSTPSSNSRRPPSSASPSAKRAATSGARTSCPSSSAPATASCFPDAAPGPRAPPWTPSSSTTAQPCDS